MLMNPDLPEKLASYRYYLKLENTSLQPEKYETKINTLSRELIDMMEVELVCEGLLYANS
jgi:hypothetical protein